MIAWSPGIIYYSLSLISHTSELDVSESEDSVAPGTLQHLVRLPLHWYTFNSEVTQLCQHVELSRRGNYHARFVLTIRRNNFNWEPTFFCLNRAELRRTLFGHGRPLTTRIVYGSFIVASVLSRAVEARLAALESCWTVCSSREDCVHLLRSSDDKGLTTIPAQMTTYRFFSGPVNRVGNNYRLLFSLGTF